MTLSMFKDAPEAWTRTTLGKIVALAGGSIQTGPFGSQLHASDYVPVGVPSIMPVNIGDNRLIRDGIACISAEDAQRLSRHIVRKGDIIYSRRGDIERRALVREEDGWFCGTGCLKVRLGDGVVSPEFAAYYLGHPEVREWIGRHAVGATMPNLNTSIMEAVPFLLPPPAEQEAIAAVLGALDDKIEQNRRTGRVLERLARATFQAWFVDFEPVKAKAAGAASFPGMPPAVFATLPDRLTDSPVGPVPQRWEVSNIGTVARRVAMGPFGSDIKTDNFVSDGVPVVRGGNLTDGFVDREFVFLTEAKADQLANANAFPGDIVITHRGTLGQIGLIPSKSRYKRYVVSQSQMLIRPNAAMLQSHFLYLFLTSSAGQHELLANRSQTGVPAISRPTTSVKAISLILPQRPVVDAFEGFASTLFNARAAAEVESSKLAALRDYLLPRLLSGRVRVRRSEGDPKA